MDVKRAGLVSVLVLAAAVGGVVVGSQLPSRAARSPTRTVRAPADRDVVAKLEQELEHLRTRNAELQRLQTPTNQPAKRPEQAVPADAPEVVPARVRAAAVDLGVPDDVMEEAWLELKKGDGTKLRKLGSVGFRALVAMIRGGIGGQRFETIFEAAWDPALAGEERLLIETVERGGGWQAGTWTALTALGVTDTAAARTFLVRQVEQVDDAGHFMSAATALGRLREARAIPALQRGMRNKQWTPQIRWRAFEAVAQIEPDKALGYFVDYVREPGADLLGPALGYIARADADAAKHEAESLLDGPYGRTWSSEQLRELRSYAGRPKPR